jgi:hypothetical protein
VQRGRILDLGSRRAVGGAGGGGLPRRGGRRVTERRRRWTLDRWEEDDVVSHTPLSIRV